MQWNDAENDWRSKYLLIQLNTKNLIINLFARSTKQLKILENFKFNPLCIF